MQAHACIEGLANFAFISYSYITILQSLHAFYWTYIPTSLSNTKITAMNALQYNNIVIKVIIMAKKH